MLRVLYQLACLVAAALLVVAGYVYYRQQSMLRLHAQAVGDPGYVDGTPQAQDAVRKLATYRGEKASRMLADVALGRGPLVWPQARREAIKALAKREGRDAELALACLLQPHEGIAVRRDAAAVLQGRSCGLECVELVLHYLERVWWGELNYEDRTIFPPGTEALRADQQSEQQALYSDLYSILRRERAETIVALTNVYGLGTDDPSPFALALLSRIQLNEACPLLEQSAELISKRAGQFYKAPTSELNSAVTSLKCLGN
jgi:hypothetical protein